MTYIVPNSLYVSLSIQRSIFFKYVFDSKFQTILLVFESYTTISESQFVKYLYLFKKLNMTVICKILHQYTIFIEDPKLGRDGCD